MTGTLRIIAYGPGGEAHADHNAGTVYLGGDRWHMGCLDHGASIGIAKLEEDDTPTIL